MAERRLYFQTGDPAINDRLFQLALMAERPHQPYKDADTLYIWLIGIIRQIRALPQPMQDHLGLSDFLIGDSYRKWTRTMIAEWQAKRAQELRERLMAYVADAHSDLSHDH